MEATLRTVLFTGSRRFIGAIGLQKDGARRPGSDHAPELELIVSLDGYSESKEDSVPKGWGRSPWVNSQADGTFASVCWQLFVLTLSAPPA
jgi:hypothetical protein